MSRPDWRCALAILALLLCAGSAHGLQTGDKAPQFTAAGLQGGEPLSLSAYRGKVVYLDFWASWCAPCLTSLPALEELRKEFGKDGFEVVAVNVDRDPDDARAFLAKRPISYRSASDPEGNLPRTFAIETMPTSFLIDRDGVIRHVHRGFRKGDVEQIREHIRELVGNGR